MLFKVKQNPLSQILYLPLHSQNQKAIKLKCKDSDLRNLKSTQKLKLCTNYVHTEISQKCSTDLSIRVSMTYNL